MSLPALRDLIAKHFTLKEIDALCLDLSIEYEELPGTTRTEKAQSLILYCLRRGQLPALEKQCRQQRGHVNWPDTTALAEEWQNNQTTQKYLQANIPGDQLAAMLAPLQQKAQEILDQLLGAGQATIQVGGDLVQGDKVGGDKVGGDKIVNNYTITDPQQPDPDALRRAYLERLLATSNRLSLAGIDPKAAGEEQETLELAAVYTALLTESREQERDSMRQPDKESRRFSALEMLNRHKKLVLLGDPGSGKSTFVNFVATCMAGELLGHARLNLALLTRPLPSDDDDNRRRKEEEPQPQPWAYGPMLPVTVVLRDLAARGLPASGPAAAHHFWGFVAAELTAASLGEYAPHLKKELLEKGGLILFDGLDEVPQANDRRQQIKELVTDVARTFGRCRILVTSRIYAYQKQAWRLPDFADTTLSSFSLGQINAFVDNWYAYIARVRNLNRDDAQGRAVLLKQAIARGQRLRELAERPLLLTLMASLHAWRGGSLPEKREELYADTVDLLLDNWEKQRVVRDAQGQVQVIQPSLQEWLRVDRDRVRRELERLAFEAHAAQERLEGTADIAESSLITALMRLSQNPDVNPARLVEYLRDRAGLLVPRGVGVYTFPHRTFQEYLAASYLTNDEYPTKIAELARTDPDRWREAALLAGARAGRGSSYALWGLVQELCCTDPDECDDLADHWGSRLAGQLLLENVDLETATPSQAQQGQIKRLRRWLAAVLVREKLPPIERAAAGRALARLGDPRPGVGVIMVRDGWKLPDIVWGGEVPEGTYWIGGDKEAWRSFGRQQVTIPYAYRLAKYPITNAQFQCFLDARDWDNEDWWKGIPEDEKQFSDPRWPYANHPRVQVSWYQAMAFCRWLTAKLYAGLLPMGELPGSPEDYIISLPHEYEWEVAARWPNESAAERLYPWGREFDVAKANTRESGIGQTAPVGMYPSGRNAALDVYDLSGNVWEWCRNLDEKPDSALDPEEIDMHASGWRVVRGGSFGFDADLARAAFRSNGDPGNRFSDDGFRVVVVRRSPSHT